MDWGDLREHMEARLFAVFVIVMVLAVAIPLLTMIVALIVGTWLQVLGHHHGIRLMTDWVNHHKHDGSSDPSRIVGLYYFAVLNVAILYLLGELMAVAFRGLRRAMA